MQLSFIHQAYRPLLRHGAAIAMAMALFACSSAPKALPANSTENTRREVVISGELARQLEAQLRVRREPEIAAYIGEIARAMASIDPELRGSSVAASVIRDRDGKWRNFSLPGVRLYLSAALLKSVQFENELAAALAFELGHVRARNVISRLGESDELPARPDFFGPSGIYAFTDEMKLRALGPAMEMMYAAGYDPRGMVSLLQRYQADSSASPHSRETLSKLIDRTREIIAQHAPLRNPIVRSDKFLAIQKRMQRL